MENPDYDKIREELFRLMDKIISEKEDISEEEEISYIDCTDPYEPMNVFCPF